MTGWDNSRLSFPPSSVSFPALMSEPTEINLATPPPAESQEFDAQAFWLQYGSTILRTLGVIVIALAVWGGYQWSQIQKTEGSALALAAAKTPDDFRKVKTEWAGTPAGALASLELGTALNNEGKYDEATTELRGFLKDNPKHQLASGALSTLAISLESAGKPDEALVIYQQITTSYPASAHAEPALINQARIYKAQNRPEDALRALDSLNQKFPGSAWMLEGMRMRRGLKAKPPTVVASEPVKVEASTPAISATPEASPTPAESPAPTPKDNPAPAPK